MLTPKSHDNIFLIFYNLDIASMFIVTIFFSRTLVKLSVPLPNCEKEGTFFAYIKCVTFNRVLDQKRLSSETYMQKVEYTDDEAF